MPASTSNSIAAGAVLFPGSSSMAATAPMGGGGGIAASSSLSLNSLELDATNGHLGSSSMATSSAAANPNGMGNATSAGLDENSRSVATSEKIIIRTCSALKLLNTCLNTLKQFLSALKGLYTFFNPIFPQQDGRLGVAARAAPGQLERH